LDLQIIDVGLHGNGFPLAGFDSNVKDLNVHLFLLILMVGSLGESHAIGFTHSQNPCHKAFPFFP